MNFNPPAALDWDGWTDFRKDFRKNAPVRYFISEVLGRKIRDIKDLLTRASWWVRHRTTDRYHVVRTGLEPGWHDVDTKLLHTSFTMLVDYVEEECAWIHIVFDNERLKEALGWKRFLPRIFRSRFRSRELGLAHLDWEATLDDPSLDEYQRCDSQAEKARIVKELYLWWVDERPQREELPYPVSEHHGLEMLSHRWRDDNKDDYEKIRQWSIDSQAQEEAWDKEDDDKLIQLIKIRKSLWT